MKGIILAGWFKGQDISTDKSSVKADHAGL